MPNVQNLEPGYQQKTLELADLKNRFQIIISPDGEKGSLVIKQDAKLLIGQFDENYRTELKTDAGRKYWLQVTKGLAEINGEDARAGDGFAIEGEKFITLKTLTDAEMLLFDLPQ